MLRILVSFWDGLYSGAIYWFQGWHLLFEWLSGTLTNFPICLFVWVFFFNMDSSYPRWWETISSPSLFKLFLDSPLQLSSSNVSLRSSESAIVTTCVVGFVVVGAWLAKVNWNRWMKFRSQWMDSVGVGKNAWEDGHRSHRVKTNGIFQDAWVRSFFEPSGIVKESSNQTSNFGHVISSKWWIRVACQKDGVLIQISLLRGYLATMK